MSEARVQKEQVVQEIKQKLETAKSLVFVDYKGLTVAQDTELRSAFRKENVEYKVLKNRLVKIALNEMGYNEFDSFLEGTTAIAFGYGDELAPAKIVANKMEEFKQIKCKCGMFEKKFIDENTVKALASIPSKEVLLAQFVGLIQSPIRGFAIAIKAIAEKLS